MRKGIHHITAYAKDPQRNADFYHRVLGQRLIKVTVNFDDPSMYHLYYGDEIGSPGTILTFFPIPQAGRGIVGNGEVGAMAYRIRPTSLVYWQRRLSEWQVNVGEPLTRFGQTVLPFRDPDGMALELIADETESESEIAFWAGGDVPQEHALLGFFGATLWVSSADATQAILAKIGYTKISQEGERHRYQTENAVGGTIDLWHRPNHPRGRAGAGSVHHIAFRTPNDATQLDDQAMLRQLNLMVTPVRDRQYFHSIYFREPNGILFEIATDSPGFTIDESAEQLGHTLQLPPEYEPHRRTIERALPRLIHPSETKR